MEVNLNALRRLSNCSRALRSCLFDRLGSCRDCVDLQTEVFIWNRSASLHRHPNIVLRGRLWHDYEESRDDLDHMHVQFGEMIADQQERLRELGDRVLRLKGHRAARDFVSTTVTTFMQQDQVDINLQLRLLELGLVDRLQHRYPDA